MPHPPTDHRPRMPAGRPCARRWCDGALSSRVRGPDEAGCAVAVRIAPPAWASTARMQVTLVEQRACTLGLSETVVPRTTFGEARPRRGAGHQRTLSNFGKRPPRRGRGPVALWVCVRRRYAGRPGPRRPRTNSFPRGFVGPPSTGRRSPTPPPRKLRWSHVAERSAGGFSDWRMRPRREWHATPSPQRAHAAAVPVRGL
jgi:hypothetical protein